MFPVSVAFMELVAFGGIIVALPTYDISMYVLLIGLKLVNSASSVKNRLPKTAFETLLVVVIVLTASCSSPPRVVVDTKIIVSVKIVATRWMLLSRDIFLLRLISILICLHSRRETKDKRV